MRRVRGHDLNPSEYTRIKFTHSQAAQLETTCPPPNYHHHALGWVKYEISDKHNPQDHTQLPARCGRVSLCASPVASCDTSKLTALSLASRVLDTRSQLMKTHPAGHHERDGLLQDQSSRTDKVGRVPEGRTHCRVSRERILGSDGVRAALQTPACATKAPRAGGERDAIGSLGQIRQVQTDGHSALAVSDEDYARAIHATEYQRSAPRPGRGKDDAVAAARGIVQLHVTNWTF